MLNKYDYIRWFLTLLLIVCIWTTHWAVPFTVTILVVANELNQLNIRRLQR